jgi:diketogulonate reductase-like aldo/keto reductase
MREVFDSGHVRSVGVCNYGKQQLEEIHGLLEKFGIPLACNQVWTSSC